MYSDKWLYNNILRDYKTLKCRIIVFVVFYSIYYLLIGSIHSYYSYSIPSYTLEEMKIFSDLTEIDELELTVIDADEQDKFLKGIAVKDGRRLRVEFKGEEYYIFAYEFYDEVSAHRYYKNYSLDIPAYKEGRNYYFDGETYYDAFRCCHYKHIILQNKKVLRIRSGNGFGFRCREFEYYINENLTENFDLFGRRTT